MNIKSNFVKRMVIGKSIGAIFGLMAFFIIPHIFVDADMFLRFGVWLWYITLGAMIGGYGLINYHPFLKISMPFWFRGTLLGAWMNFILVLFIYQKLVLLIQDSVLKGYSPFWLIIEGMIFGLLTDYIATKFAGNEKIYGNLNNIKLINSSSINSHIIDS